MDNYDRRQKTDLSSLFLVEFSDDSEADLGSSIASALVGVDNEEEEDDAQSCCNDFSGCGSGPEDDETDITGRSGYEFQDFGRVERPWEEDEDEEEGVVNMSARRQGHDSKICIQGRGRYHQKPVNETERNKIFWETCLASGY